MTTAASSTPMLEALHLSQRFSLPDGHVLEALRDVSLAVHEREVVALVGPSGCGKSTLLRALVGLARPSAGEVRYRGAPVTGVLSSAAMVFQSFALLPWLTVDQNVEMGLKARGVPEADRRPAATRAIELVGLVGFGGAYPRELSGGMKQRVGFARALAVEPEILFMDEPFGALDALTAENLRAQVVKLWRDSATSVSSLVVVTHSIEEAVYLAGRIVVFGTNPGHVREELANPLPYPREVRAPEFGAMVERLHAILTDTLLAEAEPEPERVATGSPGRLAPLPRVHVPEVMGLLDHLAGREDHSGPVFELADQLGVDYDRMSAVVRAAEQLGWLTTPGEIARLTPAGLALVAQDARGRREAARARIAEHPLFTRVLGMLREGEGSIDDDELLADLTICFPFTKAQALFRTVVEWGRYANLLDHDNGSRRLVLTERRSKART
jgi:NitT/TauT family transport system ATP-binding protein